MNVFDIIIIVFLIFGFVRGLIKGLFSEVASLIAIVAGIYCAIHFSYYTENFLRESILKWNDQTNRIVAFAATFLAVVLLVVFVGKILTKIADITALGLLNKILGGIFAVLKSALILSILFVFIKKINATIPFISDETLKTSILYEPIRKVAPTLFPSIVKDGEEGNTTFDFPKI